MKTDSLPSQCKRLTRGFTLLEMLVVILIIGMLTGIVAPRLLGQMNRSEVTTARAQLAAIDKAVQAFRYDVGRFPTSEEGLAVLMTPLANEPRWQGPYLQGAVPMDPWGQPYQYASPGASGRDYDLYSNGPKASSSGASAAGGIVTLP